MPTVKVLDGSQPYRLDHAVLFYKNNCSILATMHSINSQNQLEPGVPLEYEHLKAMFESNNTADKLRFIPSTVVAMSSSSIVWATRKKRNPIFFNFSKSSEKPLNQYNGTDIIWPELIFKFDGKNLFVWARFTSRNPGMTSKLYRAPFYNLFGNHAICLPPIPHSWNHILEAIPICEQIFFNTAFTHLGNAGQLVQYPGGATRFWLDYCEKFQSGRKAPSAFPHQVLIPLSQTLGSILR